MKELKTLKDLMKPAHCRNYAMLIKAGEIKAEAVKWVKAFEKKNCTPPFKEFFNITEDDLKETEDEK